MKTVNVFCVNIMIEAFNPGHAMRLLKRQIVEPGYIPKDMSMHPCDVEPYLPSMRVSCKSQERKIDRKWMERNDLFLDESVMKECEKIRVEINGELAVISGKENCDEKA